MSFRVKDGLRDVAPRGQTRNAMQDSRGYHKYYDISVQVDPLVFCTVVIRYLVVFYHIISDIAYIVFDS